MTTRFSTRDSTSGRIHTTNDMCYDVELKVAVYSGNTNISETFEKCLPWSKALDCADFPKSSSIWLLQSGNSCRNPRGELLQPYCYVHINGTTCQKRYCDVCSLKTSVDLIKTCSSLIAADPTFCSTSFSKYGCAKSCAYGPIQFKRGTCGVPAVPSDGTLVNSPKSTYNEGEIVKVKCKTSSSYPVSEMRCTQIGWTSLTSACKGGCDDKVSFCQDLLRTFPRFCSHTKTKDSAAQYCAKSCANCSVTTTCSAPSFSTFYRTSVSDTVNNGDVLTLSCNAGLYYWIQVKGVVTRWYYYCKTPGVMTFAVYRKISDIFSYVGANNVTCQPDYLMTYYVPAESQIPVEANDILAVHSTASNTLYVTDCDGYNLVPLNTQTIAANTFSELTTKTVSGTYCLIPSFGARVTPV